MTISSYLAFNGDCREAFETYHRILGGEIGAMMTYGEMPGDYPKSEATDGRIVHARLNVAGQSLLGADVQPEHHVTPSGTSIFVQVDSAEEAERVFGEFSEGGNVIMPLEETFWAVRFGMVTDRFGTPWMVNCSKPMG